MNFCDSFYLGGFLTSQSYLVLVISEFVQESHRMVLTMARLPDGSFLNNWYFAFAKFLPFLKGI